MSKIALISVAILTASLTIGCATNSDIENLQSQIDDLNIIKKHLLEDIQKKEDEDKQNKLNSLLFKYLESSIKPIK